ncbi:hypothetical protein MPSEU_000621900 [Mayamaea pseudoterrestris]|nr:hypothetical protein MPSEU_000621900 [Mayamaea pseudoterrestris]
MTANNVASSPSDNMIDYCAPSIRPERPKAPARRLPKDPTRTHKRNGTIEFMASFLSFNLKSTSRSESVSKEDQEFETDQIQQEQQIRKTPSRKKSSDVMPACPNRRGTMDLLLGSFRSSRDCENHDGSGETAIMSVDLEQD